VRAHILKILIAQAMAGFFYGMLASTAGFALIMLVGGYWGWVVSRLLVGTIVGRPGGGKGMLGGAVGSLFALVVYHLTASELLNWPIIGAFIGALNELKVKKVKSFERVAVGMVAGGIGGLIGWGIFVGTEIGFLDKTHHILLSILGWGILGGLIGGSQGLFERAPQKAILGASVGVVVGIGSMFVLEGVVDWVSNILRLASSVLMEGGLTGMSIWTLLTYSSIAKEKLSD
jgi:hypothetical protein